MKGRQTPLDLAWNVRLGVWGTDVTMTRNVASVRQNLTPLVRGGRPTPMVATRTWRWWGSTCSATSCGRGLPGVDRVTVDLRATSARLTWVSGRTGSRQDFRPYQAG